MWCKDTNPICLLPSLVMTACVISAGWDRLVAPTLPSEGQWILWDSLPDTVKNVNNRLWGSVSLSLATFHFGYPHTELIDFAQPYCNYQSFLAKMIVSLISLGFGLLTWRTLKMSTWALPKCVGHFSLFFNFVDKFINGLIKRIIWWKKNNHAFLPSCHFNLHWTHNARHLTNHPISKFLLTWR